MIVSFHPIFEADKNIICAGRMPNDEDLDAIKTADAVILSQGCHRSLYELARSNCPYVFPNYDARFNYPGKIGQIELFRENDAPHPASELFTNVAAFQKRYTISPQNVNFDYPFVLKLDWGGEGETVYLIQSAENLHEIIKKAAVFEKSGLTGFLLQEFIPSRNRTLRVAVIGQRLISYWRIQECSDSFHTNLRKGAAINFEADPELQHTALALVKHLCRKVRINLAGLDIIFSSKTDAPEPMLLEINYFFGRKGLGGSESYYQVLRQEIRRWLADLNLY
jgi:ribosomal protein S6--L-glutamate ligase